MQMDFSSVANIALNGFDGSFRNIFCSSDFPAASMLV